MSTFLKKCKYVILEKKGMKKKSYWAFGGYYHSIHHFYRLCVLYLRCVFFL